jgi:hypothetical protein
MGKAAHVHRKGFLEKFLRGTWKLGNTEVEEP